MRAFLSKIYSCSFHRLSIDANSSNSCHRAEKNCFLDSITFAPASNRFLNQFLAPLDKNSYHYPQCLNCWGPLLYLHLLQLLSGLFWWIDNEEILFSLTFQSVNRLIEFVAKVNEFNSVVKHLYRVREGRELRRVLGFLRIAFKHLFRL